MKDEVQTALRTPGSLFQVTSSLHNDAARDIYESAPTLCRAIVNVCWEPQPEASLHKHELLGEPTCFLWHLAEAVRFNSAELFIDYIGWAKILMHWRNIRKCDLENVLETMNDVCDAALPVETRSKTRAVIDKALGVLPSLPVSTASFVNGDTRCGKLAAKYVDSLLALNARSARALIMDSLNAGTPVFDLYDNVFAPSLREIGRLWQMNKINEGQEHYCALITENILSLIAATVDPPKRQKVVVGLCVADEQHSVGLRLALDSFALRGWDTMPIGANTPTANLQWILRVGRPDVLAISVTMTYHLREVVSIISAVREMPDDLQPLIVLGGRPLFILPTLWQQAGADIPARSCREAIELVEARLG